MVILSKEERIPSASRRMRCWRVRRSVRARGIRVLLTWEVRPSIKHTYDQTVME